MEDAVGMVLCHDMTEIIPGVSKGPAFRKGHIVTEEDIPHLLDMGKQYLYVFDLKKGYLHENDAARRMAAAVCGDGVCFGEPSEGKITLRAAFDGVLKINREAVYALSEPEEICLATIRPDRMVKQGQLIGGTRVIPLVAKELQIEAFERICQKNAPVIAVKPLRRHKIGVVTTGSEVRDGRIKDAFGPVLEQKFSEYGCEILGQTFPGDDKERIAQDISDWLQKGAELVAVTGGMSVDPDDMTPSAIRMAAKAVSYGAPVLPGAMFMLAYAEDVPVIGLPGCVMYAKRTIFDLLVPRLLCGERLDRKDIVKLAVGGQCEGCEECHFPHCGFGG